MQWIHCDFFHAFVCVLNKMVSCCCSIKCIWTECLCLKKQFQYKSTIYYSSRIFLAQMQTLWSLTFNCIRLISSDEHETRISSLFSQAYIDWRVFSLERDRQRTVWTPQLFFPSLWVRLLTQPIYFYHLHVFYSIMLYLKKQKSLRCKHSLWIMDVYVSLLTCLRCLPMTFVL